MLQLREDIRRFKSENNLDRLVTVWCGSTEIFIPEAEVHQSLSAFEKGMKENDPNFNGYNYKIYKNKIDALEIELIELEWKILKK